MLIGAGKRRDGLYYFQSLRGPKALKVEKSNSLDLWHARMGQPSTKVTKLVPIVFVKRIVID